MKRKMSLRLHTWKYLALLFTSCFLVWHLRPVFRGDTVPKVKPLPVRLPHEENEKLDKLLASQYNRHPDLERLTTKSSIYNEILADANMHSLLSNTSFHDRCMNYFNHLSENDPNWMVDPNRGLVFNRDAYKNFDQYRDQKLREFEEWKNEDEENRGSSNPPSEDHLRTEYEDIRFAVLGDEQVLHDTIAHARIFDKCFMGDIDGVSEEDITFAKNQQSFFKHAVKIESSISEEETGNILNKKVDSSKVENKIFPWLTKKLPVFTRWDGTSAVFPGNTAKSSLKKDCFLTEYKSRLSGRGIVLTLGDDHVNDATRFLRLLRHLGNAYPVQVVYTSNLSKDSQEKLVRAAREKFRGYPEIELWFVNAERAIDAKFIEKFGGFANKVMATMFNSFEEIILCDADSVLLKDPSYFFGLKKYIQTGTFFYKDRATGFFRPRDDSVFFQKLMPSVEDSAMFNIAQTTSLTLDNEFFHGLADYMESGVVAINRKKHFIQPMIMSLLNFYDPVKYRIHGDKELFWLALSLGGDENYAINSHFAAAIGEFTPETERHKDIGRINSFRSKEICSNHPAHISDTDNQTLVWFNSGFRHCGNSFKEDLNWEEEFDKKTRYTRIDNIEEFKTFFKSELKITHAIVPPVDSSEMRNVEDEPAKPWILANYCRGYLWCAYSSIGGYYVEDEVTKDNMKSGLTVAFTPDQIEEFDAAADAWLAPFDWQ